MLKVRPPKKAVERDDAEVPEHFWNFRIAFLLGTTELNQQQYRSAAVLRQVMLRRWKRNVLRSWGVWWPAHQAVICRSSSDDWALLWERGVEACDHALLATFWSWPRGSRIFYWRWPREYLIDVAIGVPPMWINPPAHRITQQRNLRDRDTISKITEKLDDVRMKGYILPGPCVTTMNYFAVPKGKDGCTNGIQRNQEQAQ
ncbi:hypothetical protein ACA910_010232 [Epithemia clementina (nom. ined.)]